MHAIKGAWIGRTYALANSNDSGGRKSRIRRSKEERKELTVSFIKSYQKLNNGSFPSLNLTHKEVGGSFYTVREIVREIIQENRVLAPPKLLPGEHNTDSFLEQYPLGSISVEPQIDVVSSNENQVLVNHRQYSSDSRSIIELDQGKFDNGTIVNGSAHIEAKQSKKPLYTGFLLERGAEGEKAGERELNAYLVTASNIDECVGEETSSQKGHNVESFLEHDTLKSSFVDPSPEEHNVESFFEQGAWESSSVDPSPEEHNIESFLEQGALESSFVDPQIDVESLDESKIVVSHHQSTNEEQVLDARPISKSDQGRPVNGTIVNGDTNAIAEIKESKELIYGESLLERGVDKDKAEAKELGDQATSQIAEGLLVETFPLRPIPHKDYDLDAKLNKPVFLVGALKEKDTEDLEVEAENSSVPDRLHFLENSSEIVDNNAGRVLAGQLPETNGVLLDKKAPPTKESTALGVNYGRNLDVKDTLPTRNKPTVAPNGVFAGNLRQATSDEAAASKKQSDIVDGGGSSNMKEIDPTLDRTKLESWESTSEKSAGQETNPLMAFIKAFITAFVKVWSE